MGYYPTYPAPSNTISLISPPGILPPNSGGTFDTKAQISETFVFETTIQDGSYPWISNALGLVVSGSTSNATISNGGGLGLTITMSGTPTSNMGDGPVILSSMVFDPTLNWCLSFALDFSTFNQSNSWYKIGTTSYYMYNFRRDGDGNMLADSTFLHDSNDPLDGQIHMNPACEVNIVFGGFNAGEISAALVIDGTTAAWTALSNVSFALQNIVFSDVVSSNRHHSNTQDTTPVVISNFFVQAPSNVFSPTIDATFTGALLPYITIGQPYAYQSTFVSPDADLSTSPTIVLVQSFNGDIQRQQTIFTVNQVGDIPAAAIVSTPAFPITTPFIETVPFSYTFSSANNIYYQPSSSNAIFTSLGDTLVGTSISNTFSDSNITIPGNFTQVIVTSDRIYQTSYLYANQIELLIHLPYFVSNFDSGSISFGPGLTATLSNNHVISFTTPSTNITLAGKSLSNTLLLTSPSYLTALPYYPPSGPAAGYFSASFPQPGSIFFMTANDPSTSTGFDITYYSSNAGGGGYYFNLIGNPANNWHYTLFTVPDTMTFSDTILFGTSSPMLNNFGRITSSDPDHIFEMFTINVFVAPLTTWPLAGTQFTVTNKGPSDITLFKVLTATAINGSDMATWITPNQLLHTGNTFTFSAPRNMANLTYLRFSNTYGNLQFHKRNGFLYVELTGVTGPMLDYLEISATKTTTVTSFPQPLSTLKFTNTTNATFSGLNAVLYRPVGSSIDTVLGTVSNLQANSNYSVTLPSTINLGDYIRFSNATEVLTLSNEYATTQWYTSNSSVGTIGSFLDVRWDLTTIPVTSNYTYIDGEYLSFFPTSSNQYAVTIASLSAYDPYNHPIGTAYNVSSASFYIEFNCFNGYDGGDTPFTLFGRSNIQVYPPQYPLLYLDQTDSTGGTVLLNEYASGVGTNTLKIASSNGFSNTISNAVWRVIGAYGGSNVVQVQSYFTIIPQYVGSTPSFPTPFSTLIYTPYSYTFTLPITTPYTMITSNSDSNVRPLLVNNTSNVVFASTTGFTSPLAYGYLEIDGQVGGNTVASLSSYISVSSNVITQSPTFTGSFTFYKYEPFGPITFTLDSNVVGLTLQYTLSDPPIRSFCTLSPDKRTLTFAGSYNTSYASTLNMFVHAVDSGGIVRSTIRNFVTINPSRFFPPTSNQAFIFYKNEAISVTYGSNLPFQTTVSLDSIPTCTPSLPAGLSFASVSQSTSNFVLQGTPTSQSPSNQYLVVGSNTSTNRVVTVPISIYVKPSRIVVSPSSLTLSTLAVGVPITPVTFTAIQPVSLTSAFKYYWDIPPDGLVFRDLNGNTLVQPFTPTDSSLSIVLAGTPTSNAAYSFMNTSTLYAFHYEPPGIEVEQRTTITYGFVTSVLFTPVTLPNIYATETLPTNSIVISAATYFPSGSPILSITALSLPDGMTLTFSPPNRAYLNGTPTTVSSGTYTFTAVNSLGITGTLNLAIPILQNVVTFTSSTPANATFIVSRPLTAPLSTYYTYPITFTATSAISTQSITYSTSFDITPYGLALVTSNGSATLTGTPTGPLPTTTLNIIASDVLGTTASVPIQLTILADAYSFNTPTLSFVQHVDITPVQITASTLSGRQILYYSSSNLPSGLSLSRLGVLTGTPANSNSGTFTVVASTGYPPAVTSPPFSYTVTPDNVLILMTTNPLALSSTTFSVDAFRAVTYSGYTGTLSIDDATVPSDTTLSISGTVLSGTLPSYPTSFVFTVDATYLNTTSTLPVTLYFNGGVGSISTPVSAGSLVFVTPTQPVFLLYQHCPIQPIVFHVTGNTGFVYYYTVEANLPIGLSFDTSTATISGTPAVYSDMLSSITVYAVNNGNVTFKTIQMRVITPFFVNPQETGASAYTVLLRNQVTVNGAQNSRDGVVYPTADMSLGSLQSPGAANVNTPDVPCCKK